MDTWRFELLNSVYWTPWRWVTHYEVKVRGIPHFGWIAEGVLEILSHIKRLENWLGETP